MNQVLDKNNSINADSVTRNAAHLATVEVALGTVIHSVHLPFGGHLLSLNEGAFLCRASNEAESRRSASLACYEISGVASAMKSLAPAAKKLGPMLSIMMQGLLFSLGLLIAGPRRAGQFIGFALLSIWAFVQPFITLFISFGPNEMEKVIQFYLSRLEGEYQVWGQTILVVVLGLYFVKCIAGIVISIGVSRLDETAWAQWQNRLFARAQKIVVTNREPAKKSRLSPALGAMRDITKPLFLFSFALTFIFLFIQKETISGFVWMALRPLAIAFIIFYLLRAPWFVVFCEWAAQHLGLLRPIHRRLLQVQSYLAARS